MTSAVIALLAVLIILLVILAFTLATAPQEPAPAAPTRPTDPFLPGLDPTLGPPPLEPGLTFPGYGPWDAPEPESLRLTWDDTGTAFDTRIAADPGPEHSGTGTDTGGSST